jgi:hypothetical protein
MKKSLVKKNVNRMNLFKEPTLLGEEEDEEEEEVVEEVEAEVADLKNM